MSPSPHDIIEVTSLSHGGCSVSCACGRRFVATSPDRARARHAGHFGVEQAKAALQGATADPEATPEATEA